MNCIHCIYFVYARYNNIYAGSIISLPIKVQLHSSTVLLTQAQQAHQAGQHKQGKISEKNRSYFF